MSRNLPDMREIGDEEGEGGMSGSRTKSLRQRVARIEMSVLGEYNRERLISQREMIRGSEQRWQASPYRQSGVVLGLETFRQPAGISHHFSTLDSCIRCIVPQAGTHPQPRERSTLESRACGGSAMKDRSRTIFYQLSCHVERPRVHSARDEPTSSPRHGQRDVQPTQNFHSPTVGPDSIPDP